MEIVIKEKLIKYNFSSRDGEKIQYLVLHDTGNTRTGANAESHYTFFNSGDKQSSAHYFVDDSQILRIVKDSNKSWHCGDGRGKYGITNENSIGIEMCINSDGNFDKMYTKTVSLVKHLMEEYNISIDNVVRHYDASRKICPNIMSANNWSKWHQFKNDVKYTDYKDSLKLLYKNLFNREADSYGLTYWDFKLNNGMSYGDMLKYMSDSDEFKKIYYIWK